MAKIHILDLTGIDTYNVVCHTATPIGNNSAGVAWSEVVKNSGRATSIMPVGNGPGQITQSELNQVQAGTVIEGTFPWQDNPAWTDQERADDLTLRANQMTAELLASYQQDLKFFGRTQS